MIRSNRIKEAMRNGRKAYGVRLTFPSPEIVDMLEPAALDFVFLDCEHGILDMPAIENVCRAADLTGPTPIARIPDIGSGTIAQFLDRGIRGIIGPHIETLADAKQLVDACLFGPAGRRSFGGARGTDYQSRIEDMQAFLAACNESVLVGAMLESALAIENLDDILSVPGIDYLMFGPADFAQDLGFPGRLSHPDVMKATEAAVARIHAAGHPMREDIMVIANVKNLLLDGARRFVSSRDC
jgi:2-keto-3-deoxy-L-rhamnonate aldolase RhmA